MNMGMSSWDLPEREQRWAKSLPPGQQGELLEQSYGSNLATCPFEYDRVVNYIENEKHKMSEHVQLRSNSYQCPPHIIGMKNPSSFAGGNSTSILSSQHNFFGQSKNYAALMSPHNGEDN